MRPPCPLRRNRIAEQLTPAAAAGAAQVKHVSTFFFAVWGIRQESGEGGERDTHGRRQWRPRGRDGRGKGGVERVPPVGRYAAARQAGHARRLLRRRGAHGGRGTGLQYEGD